MNDNVLIKVRGLKKYYNNGKVKAIDGVDIDIKKGEVVVVVGPSGSGKSTFLRSLNLLEMPTEGQIFFDGEDINSKDANINLHRQKMGMVFQHFNLFPHKTVLSNITLAPMKLTKMKKAEAEKKAMDTGSCSSGSDSFIDSQYSSNEQSNTCTSDNAFTYAGSFASGD